MPFFVRVIVKDISLTETVALYPETFRVCFPMENGQTRLSSCAKDGVEPAFFDGLHDSDARFPISHRY